LLATGKAAKRPERGKCFLQFAVKMEEILTKKNDEIQGKSLDNGKSLAFNKFYT
jgi:hypothetical protein